MSNDCIYHSTIQLTFVTAIVFHAECNTIEVYNRYCIIVLILFPEEKLISRTKVKTKLQAESLPYIFMFVFVTAVCDVSNYITGLSFSAQLSFFESAFKLKGLFVKNRPKIDSLIEKIGFLLFSKEESNFKQ